MMYEGMSVAEMEEMVYDLECESCEGCPFASVCGEHELFWVALYGKILWVKTSNSFHE